MLEPTDGEAYWGRGYITYFGGTKEVYRCPGARIVDEWREQGKRFPARVLAEFELRRQRLRRDPV